jgi:hypothetical protein
MNVNLLIISYKGLIRETTIKNFNEDALYKKCCFKNNDYFKNHYSWDIEYNDKEYTIKLFGKNNGRVNLLNTFEFPSYINTDIYGKCIILCTERNGNLITNANLTIEMWELIIPIIKKKYSNKNNRELIDFVDHENGDNINDKLYSIELTEDSYIEY